MYIYTFYIRLILYIQGVRTIEHLLGARHDSLRRRATKRGDVPVARAECVLWCEQLEEVFWCEHPEDVLWCND